MLSEAALRQHTAVGREPVAADSQTPCSTVALDARACKMPAVALQPETFLPAEVDISSLFTGGVDDIAAVTQPRQDVWISAVCKCENLTSM